MKKSFLLFLSLFLCFLLKAETVSFTVSFTTNSYGSLTGESTQTVDSLSDASAVTAVPNSYYHFDEWQNTSGDSISTDNPITITSVYQDSSLKAIFIPDTFTVSFTADENGTISGDTLQSVVYPSNSSTVTAIAVTAGYGFVEWQDADGNTVSTYNPLTISAKKDYALKAIFAEKYQDGIGSDEDPYQISTLEDLKNLSESMGDWSRSFILTSNIDASETSEWNISGSDTSGFTPIGNGSAYFTGTFNGQGHTISNVYINSSSTSFVGFFGGVNEGSVYNLRLVNCDVTGNGNYVGGLAGIIRGYSEVSNCFYSGSVTGKNYVGGLLGSNARSELSESYSTGSVSGNAKIGGLVGQNYIKNITNCFSTASVSGSQEIGGLIGENTDGSEVSNSYSAGIVSGSSKTGGFVGYNNSSSYITNCYYDSITSGQDTAIGGDTYSQTVKELTTEQFLVDTNFADWDFESTWKILRFVGFDTIIRPYLQSSCNIVYFKAGENCDSISGFAIQGIISGSDALEVTAYPSGDYFLEKWKDQDGNTISTDNPFTYENVTKGGTLYAVCGGGSETSAVNSFSTDGFSDLTAYPNPTTGKINISTELEGNSTISVYSLTGELVYNSLVYTNEVIDLSELNEGMYVVQLTSNGKTSVTKLMKK